MSSLQDKTSDLVFVAMRFHYNELVLIMNKITTTYFYISQMFLAVCLLFLPSIASAQGFVTCEGASCSACNLVETGNLLLVWLIGVAFVFFAVIAVVAGFGLVTSGGNSSALQAAKDKFVNAFIGLIIVLAAWILVDTIMVALLKGTGGTIEGFGVWAEVDCQVQNNAVAIAAQQAIATSLTGVSTWKTNPAGVTQSECDQIGIKSDGTPEYDCGAKAAECSANGGGTPAVNEAGGVVTCNPNSNPLPVSTGACTPLNPVSDSLALQMENGTKVIWANTDPRLQKCAQKLGSVTSAYRPAAYQAHLKEIHTKWCVQGLQSNTDPVCAAVKSEVSAEMSKHGLSCTRPVATVSNHTNGLAVDVSGGPNRDGQCMKWYGSGDPVHYTLISGCSCD